MYNIYIYIYIERERERSNSNDNNVDNDNSNDASRPGAPGEAAGARRGVRGNRRVRP